MHTESGFWRRPPSPAAVAGVGGPMFQSQVGCHCSHPCTVRHAREANYSWDLWTCPLNTSLFCCQTRTYMLPGPREYICAFSSWSLKKNSGYTDWYAGAGSVIVCSQLDRRAVRHAGSRRRPFNIGVVFKITCIRVGALAPLSSQSAVANGPACTWDRVCGYTGGACAGSWTVVSEPG